MEKLSGFNESKEANKYKPSEEVLSSFLNLPSEATETFMTRLACVGGHLRIWVHPFYTKQLPSSIGRRLGDHDLIDIQEKMENAFYRTCESVLKNQASSPLIVYEPKIYLAETKELIASHLDCDSSDLEALGIVFIPTERDTSTPDFDHFIASLRSGDECDTDMANDILTFRNAVDQLSAYEGTLITKMHTALPQLKEDPYTILSEEEYDLLLTVTTAHAESKKNIVEKHKEALDLDTIDSKALSLYSLRHLGTNSAIVSGAYLEAYPTSESTESRFSACAGAVVNQLRNDGIPTDISANIWPPKDLLREAGNEIKQTGSTEKLDQD